MAAYTFLAVKRRNREQHSDLSIQLLAASGNEKEVKKQLEDWERDA
jgi:hypothetical protein